MKRDHRGIWAIAFFVSAASVAACGGSGSGGTAGGGGTSSTHTTSTGGTGGSATGTGGTGGSATGTGGSTGGADGGACVTCADWAATNGSPDNICAGDSKTNYDALIKCVCTDQCATECAGASPCVPMGTPNATCGTCEGAKCGSEATACLSH